MNNMAYIPLNAYETVAKPGRVIVCKNGELGLTPTSGPYVTSGARKTWSSHARCWRGILVLIASLILTACLSKEPQGDPDGTFGSSVTAMDHDPSDTFVRTVFVNGRWVGEASGGGGIVAGGISLPRRWRPGLTAVVKWERCEPYGKNCRWTEKVVPIHQYKEVGGTWLHILKGDKVLIIPSMLAPGHPEYPGPDFPSKDFFRNTGKDQPK